MNDLKPGSQNSGKISFFTRRRGVGRHLNPLLPEKGESIDGEVKLGRFVPESKWDLCSNIYHENGLNQSIFYVALQNNCGDLFYFFFIRSDMSFCQNLVF